MANKNKSFLEKMNDANYGKRGLYIAGITLLAILVIKLLVVPFLQPLEKRPFFASLKYWNNIIENIALFNIIAFFLCIIFFRQQIGGKLLYAMQLKDKTYFKDKWILIWLKSIWVCLGIIAITTVIGHAFFKSWMSFIFLCIFISIPFYLMPKLQSRQQNFFN